MTPFLLHLLRATRPLLAEHGFDAVIQRKAERVAAWLARHRHAGDGVGVLASG